MNIIIFGASGGIGKLVVKHALQEHYTVTAYIRDSQKLKITDKNLTVIQGEISNYAQICAALSGQDVVIWCVGVPLKRTYSHMASLEGHQLLIKAMHQCHISRLIDWATPSVPFYQDKKSMLTIFPGILAGIIFKQAKQEMIAIGQLVEHSDLDWTIVRFLAPQNGPYTGKVKVSFGDTKINFAISREDIAAFMVAQIKDNRYIHSMPIIGG